MDPVTERELSARSGLLYDGPVSDKVLRFAYLDAGNAAVRRVNDNAINCTDHSVLLDENGHSIAYTPCTSVHVRRGDKTTPWDWLVTRYKPGAGWILLLLRCAGEDGTVLSQHVVSPAKKCGGTVL